MMSKELYPGLWFLGMEDQELRTFRRVAYTDAGVMYAAYLMDVGEKYLLIGTPPGKYTAKWLAAIQKIAGKKDIGWIVVFGEESDRTAVKSLLDCYPAITVIAGTNPMYKLRGFAGDAFCSIEIRNHRHLQLGEKKFSFYVLQDKQESPSVYLVDEERKLLFTADAFGALCAPGTVQVSAMEHKEAYFRGARQYFMDIYGAARPGVMRRAKELVEERKIRAICPAYGPVVDEGLEKLLALYEPFAGEREKAGGQKQTLALVCAPGGYVRELADQIEAGILESGEIRVARYNLEEISREEVLTGIAGAEAFLFGTPEVKGDAAKAIWDLMTSLTRKDCRGKLAAVFGNGPVDGTYTKGLRQRMDWLGLGLTTADYYVQGKPQESQLHQAYEYGFDISCILRRMPNPRKPKLVKCLVCGEIFDASLGICPVCGVGLEQCVPVDEASASYHRDTDRRYLILGGGVAAVSAAEAIRQRDGTGSITMVSKEPYLPINRPMLTKDLKLAEEEPESLAIHEQDWYTERAIGLRLGEAVTSIDPAKKKVITDRGEELFYDKLVYAAGAECFIPPFAGREKEEVLTIRHLSDSRKLGQLMKKGSRAVVIGGGVLGLEAASELMRAGIQVTVLEASPQIVGRQVDAETAQCLKKIMQRMHVPCYEGVSIEEIEGQEHVTGVRISDGTVFAADFVVVSCGNRGNIEAAKSAGIAVERAIVVNSRMETNVGDIYACGDCAQFEGVNYQLWQEAGNQGRIAGANAAGERLAYAKELLGLSLEGFGTSLYAIGDPGKKEDMPYRLVRIQDEVEKSQEKYWFYGDLLQGAVLIGHPKKVAQITQQVTTHARHSEIF